MPYLLFLPGLQLYAFLPIFRPPFAVEIKAIRLVKKERGLFFSFPSFFLFACKLCFKRQQRKREKKRAKKEREKLEILNDQFSPNLSPFFFLWGKSTKRGEMEVRVSGVVERTSLCNLPKGRERREI